MPVAVVPWTEQRVDELKRLHAEGLSFGLIAGIMGGITRNAAIGKSQRLGLAPRKTETLQRQPRTILALKPKRKSPTQSFQGWLKCQAITDLPPDTPDNPATLVELGDHQCRWPCSGEPRDMVFCGGQAVERMPYCVRHCKIAYGAPQRMTAAEYHAEGRRRLQAMKDRLA